MADLSIRSLWVRMATPHLYSCEVSELITLIRQGSQPACCALYDRFKRPLVRFAYYLSENEKRAQKLVQQAFLDFFIFVKERGGPDVKEAAPWLYRHVIKAYTAEFPIETPIHKEKRSFGLGLDEVESLAKKPQKHLLAVLSEMLPRSRALFLLWVLSGLDTDQQALVFELGRNHWLAQWEQASLEAVEWSRIIENDHKDEEV